MLLSDLGVALRKARKERGLTLKQAGERAGVHFTTLSSLERGRVSEFGVRKLLRVAETLGLELALRPEGQRYTLDDVARERGGLDRKADRPQERSEDALTGYKGRGGLLARALRRPLHQPPKFDAVDDTTVSKSKKSK